MGCLVADERNSGQPMGSGESGLGHVHISHLLSQHSVIAALVAACPALDAGGNLAELCIDSGAECSEIPATSAGMTDISAGMTGTLGLNDPM